MSENIASQINETNQNLFAQLDSFDEQMLNKVPYADSWTAAQVANHLTKSDRFINQLLNGPTRSTSRPPDQYIKKLSDIFLNFESKMKSPDMIVPDDRIFGKPELVNDIKSIRAQVLESASKVDLALTTTVDSPLGESTLLEILHFHLYHTKRHLHQLKKIQAALQGVVTI